MRLPEWFRENAFDSRSKHGRRGKARVSQSALVASSLGQSERLEERTLLTDLTFTASGNAALTLDVYDKSGEDFVRIANNNNASDFQEVKLADLTSLQVVKSGFDVSLEVDSTALGLSVPVGFDTGSGTGTLSGPTGAAWTVNDDGTGTLSHTGLSIDFQNVDVVDTPFADVTFSNAGGDVTGLSAFAQAAGNQLSVTGDFNSDTVFLARSGGVLQGSLRLTTSMGNFTTDLDVASHTSADVAALQSALTSIAVFTDALGSDASRLSEALPILDDASLGDLLGLGAYFEDALVTPAGNLASLTTIDEIARELSSAGISPTITFTATDITVVFDVNAVRTFKGVGLNLGAEVGEWLTADTLTGDVTTTVAWQFAVTTDDTSSVDFDLDQQDFSFDATVDEQFTQASQNFLGRVGLLGVEVGHVNGQQSAITLTGFDFSLNTTSLGAMLDDAALLNADPSTLAATAAGSGPVVAIDLYADAVDFPGAFPATPEIHFTDTYFDGTEPDFVVDTSDTTVDNRTNFVTVGVADFFNSTPQTIRTQLEQFSLFLGFLDIGALEVDSLPVSLTSTRVGDVYDLQKAFMENVLPVLEAETVSSSTALVDLRFGFGVRTVAGDDILVQLQNGTSFTVDLSSATTVGDLIADIEAARDAASLSNTDFTVELIDERLVLTDLTTASGSDEFSVRALHGSPVLMDLGLDREPFAGTNGPVLEAQLGASASFSTVQQLEDLLNVESAITVGSLSYDASRQALSFPLSVSIAANSIFGAISTATSDSEFVVNGQIAEDNSLVGRELKMTGSGESRRIVSHVYDDNSNTTTVIVDRDYTTSLAPLDAFEVTGNYIEQLALPDLGSLTEITTESQALLTPTGTLDLDGLEFLFDELGSTVTATTLISELNAGRGMPAALATRSASTFTIIGNAIDGETVTIGSRTYTFRDAPSAADDVLIGSSAGETARSLIAAINGTGISGTDYGAGTVLHADVFASEAAPGVVTVQAKSRGSLSSAITVSTTAANASWSAAELTGGTSIDDIRVQLFDGTAFTVDLDHDPSEVAFNSTLISGDDFTITLGNGDAFGVDLDGATTVGDVVRLIEARFGQFAATSNTTSEDDFEIRIRPSRGSIQLVDYTTPAQNSQLMIADASGSDAAADLIFDAHSVARKFEGREGFVVEASFFTLNDLLTRIRSAAATHTGNSGLFEIRLNTAEDGLEVLDGTGSTLISDTVTVVSAQTNELDFDGDTSNLLADVTGYYLRMTWVDPNDSTITREEFRTVTSHTFDNNETTLLFDVDLNVDLLPPDGTSLTIEIHSAVQSINNSGSTAGLNLFGIGLEQSLSETSRIGDLGFGLTLDAGDDVQVTLQDGTTATVDLAGFGTQSEIENASVLSILEFIVAEVNNSNFTIGADPNTGQLALLDGSTGGSTFSLSDLGSANLASLLGPTSPSSVPEQLSLFGPGVRVLTGGVIHGDEPGQHVGLNLSTPSTLTTTVTLDTSPLSTGVDLAGQIGPFAVASDATVAGSIEATTSVVHTFLDPGNFQGSQFATFTELSSTSSTHMAEVAGTPTSSTSTLDNLDLELGLDPVPSSSTLSSFTDNVVLSDSNIDLQSAGSLDAITPQALSSDPGNSANLADLLNTFADSTTDDVIFALESIDEYLTLLQHAADLDGNDNFLAIVVPGLGMSVGELFELDSLFDKLRDQIATDQPTTIQDLESSILTVLSDDFGGATLGISQDGDVLKIEFQGLDLASRTVDLPFDLNLQSIVSAADLQNAKLTAAGIIMDGDPDNVSEFIDVVISGLLNINLGVRATVRGTSTVSGSTTDLVDANQSFGSFTDLVGREIEIVAGTGGGQTRVITSVDSANNRIVVDRAWSVALGDDSEYIIRRSFLYGTNAGVDETELSFTLAADETDLDLQTLMRSSSVGIFSDSSNGLESSYQLHKSGDSSSDAEFSAVLGSDANFSSDAADGTTTSVDAEVSTTLYLAYSAELQQPTTPIQFSMPDLSDQSTSGYSLSGPPVDDDLGTVDLRENLDGFRIGFDQLLKQLDEAVQAQLFSDDASTRGITENQLPLVGNQLENAVDFIHQIREKMSDHLATETATLTPETARQALFEALGPGGLNWMTDRNGDSSISIADIDLAATNNLVTFEVSLEVLDTKIAYPVDFDSTLPALGLELNTLVDVTTSFSMPNLHLGFSTGSDGAFLGVDSGDDFVITVDATLPETTIASGTATPVTIFKTYSFTADSGNERTKSFNAVNLLPSSSGDLTLTNDSGVNLDGDLVANIFGVNDASGKRFKLTTVEFLSSGNSVTETISKSDLQKLLAGSDSFSIVIELESLQNGTVGLLDEANFEVDVDLQFDVIKPELQDSSASFDTSMEGALISIVSGTGAGQTRTIKSVDSATALTIDGEWDEAIGTDSEYVISRGIDGRMGILPVRVFENPRGDTSSGTEVRDDYRYGVHGTTFLSGEFVINLADDISPNDRLSLNELMTAGADAIDGGFTGSADLNLHLHTDLPAGTEFPPFRMVVTLPAGEQFSYVDGVETAPSAIRVTAVEFELVGFVRDFAGPSVERFVEALEPLEGLVDFLNSTEFAVLSFFLGSTTYVNAIGSYGGEDALGNFAGAVVGLQRIVSGGDPLNSDFLSANFLPEAVKEVAPIADLTGQAWIPVGEYTIGFDDAREPAIASNGAKNIPPLASFSRLPFQDSGDGDNDRTNSLLDLIEVLSEDESNPAHLAAKTFLVTQGLAGANAVNNFVGGVFLTPSNLFASGVAPIEFHILEGSTIFELLQGDIQDPTADLFSYDTPNLLAGLNVTIPFNLQRIAEQFLPGFIVDKLLGKVADPDADSNNNGGDKKTRKKLPNSYPYLIIAWEAKADFAMGFDAVGLQSFGVTRNPQDIANGFYLDADASVEDTSNTVNLSAEPDPDQSRIFGGIGLGWTIEFATPTKKGFGFSAAFGVEGLLLFGETLSLIDPNEDGRLRLYDFERQVNRNDNVEIKEELFEIGIGVEVRIDIFANAGVTVPVLGDLDLVDIRINVLTLVTPDAILNPDVALPPADLAEKKETSDFTLDADMQSFLADLGISQTNGKVLFLNGPDGLDDSKNSGQTIYVGPDPQFLTADFFQQVSPDQWISVSDGTAFETENQMAGFDVIIGFGGSGDDQIFISPDLTVPVIIFGNGGNDTLVAGGGPALLVGGSGDDILLGSDLADILLGGDGNDIIFGADGDDLIIGGLGLDDLQGWLGADVIYGDEQGDVSSGDADIIDGGTENDEIHGGGGDDDIRGNLGHDQIFGDDGNDVILGGDGRDDIEGGAGADHIEGGLGNDVIDGGTGDDFILGGEHRDDIQGGDGNDELDGEGATDEVRGGAGNDIITAVIGNDFLDGEDGSDDYLLGFQGGAESSLVTVQDTGASSLDTDRFFATGTVNDDEFLIRAATNGKAFVALLNTVDAVERINYTGVERIQISGSFGDDFFAIDDTAAEITINGDSGNDTFQVGQLFRSERTEVAANVDPDDVFATIETTRGFLSNGISFPMTINGGSDNDTFIVYHNAAVLTLNGEGGDDQFEIKAFALAGSQEPQRERTDISGGAGADLVEYAVNAPVNIDGGDGTDTLVAIGTEFGDDFVITRDGIFGAGLNVNFTNIEKLRVDGAEGDDRFYIQSTDATLTTELFGGLGSDTFNVSGDVPPVVSNDLLGHSGIITHDAISLDTSFDGKTLFGISANVGDNDEPGIAIRQSDGSTIVTEGTVGADGVSDNYQVVLTSEPLSPVFVKVLAPLPTNEQREVRSRLFGVMSHHSDSLTADDGTSVTLMFTKDNWFIPQTVIVFSDDRVHPQTGQPFDDPSGILTRPELGDTSAFTFDDQTAEGVQFGFINHIVIAGTDQQDGDLGTTDVSQLIGARRVTAELSGTFASGEAVSVDIGGTSVTETTSAEVSSTLDRGLLARSLADAINSAGLPAPVTAVAQLETVVRFSDGGTAGDQVTVTSDAFGTVTYTLVSADSDAQTLAANFAQFLIDQNLPGTTAVAMTPGGGTALSVMTESIPTGGLDASLVETTESFISNVTTSITISLVSDDADITTDDLTDFAVSTDRTGSIALRLDGGNGTSVFVTNATGFSGDIIGRRIDIVDGPGAGQSRFIVGDDGAGLLTVDRPWDSEDLPDATSVYQVFIDDALVGTGADSWIDTLYEITGTVETGDIFTATFNNQQIDYTVLSTDTSAADIAAGLAAAINNGLGKIAADASAADGTIWISTVSGVNVVVSVTADGVTTDAEIAAVMQNGEPVQTFLFVDSSGAFPTSGEGLTGRVLQIVGGAGIGQQRLILGNTATELILNGPWSTPANTSSVFRIEIFDGLAAPGVRVQVNDNDQLGIIVEETGDGTDVVEGSTQDSISVRLTQAPSSGSVTVALANPDGDLGISSNTLTLTDAASQSITVTAANDSDREGFHSGLIEFTLTGGDQDVTLTNSVSFTVAQEDADFFVGLPHFPKSSAVTVTIDGTVLDATRFDVDRNRILFLDSTGAPELRSGTIDVDYDYTVAGFESSLTPRIIAGIHDDEAPTVIVRESGGSTDVIELDSAVLTQVVAYDQTVRRQNGIVDGQAFEIVFDVSLLATTDATLEFDAETRTDLLRTPSFKIELEDGQTIIVPELPVGEFFSLSTILPSDFNAMAADGTFIVKITAADADSSTITKLKLNLKFNGTVQTQNVTSDSYELVLSAAPTDDVTVFITPQITKTTRTGGIRHDLVQVLPTSQDSRAVANYAVTIDANTILGDTYTVTIGSDSFSETVVTEDAATIATNLADAINLALGSAGVSADASAMDGTLRITLPGGDAFTAQKTTGTGDVTAIAVSLESLAVTFGPGDWDQPVTIDVAAIDDPVVDGGDTKVFALGPNTVAQIQGPVVIEGGGGDGSLGAADPLLLPGETNIKESTGPVFAIDNTNATVVTVQTADLQAILGDLGLTNVTDLVDKTLEITALASTLTDPAILDVLGQFRRIVAVTDNGATTDLELNDPFLTEEQSYEVTLSGTVDAGDQFALLFDGTAVAVTVGSETTIDDVAAALAAAINNAGLARTTATSSGNVVTVITLPSTEVRTAVLADVGTTDAGMSLAALDRTVLSETEITEYAITAESLNFFVDEATQIDFLFLHDEDSQADSDGLLTPTTLTGLNMGPAGAEGFGITYGDLEVMELNLGQGSNSFRVQGTAVREDGFETWTIINTGDVADPANPPTTDDVVTITLTESEETTFSGLSVVDASSDTAAGTGTIEFSTSSLAGIASRDALKGQLVRTADGQNREIRTVIAETTGLLGSTVFTGDVVEIEFGTQTASYTVQSTDNRDDVAVGLTNAVNALGLAGVSAVVLETLDGLVITTDPDMIPQIPSGSSSIIGLTLQSTAKVTVEGIWENVPAAGDTVDIIKPADGRLAVNTQGGDDRIDALGSTKGIVAFGGLGNDWIRGGQGEDILFGDRGRVDFYADLPEGRAIVTRLGTAPAPITGSVTAPFTNSSELNDDQASFPVPNDAANGLELDTGLVGLYVDINNGTGFLQEPRLITGNGSQVLFIAPDFTETLDATSEYRISTVPEDQTDLVNREANFLITVDDDLGGDDEIRGGAGSDQLFGGAGEDLINGNADADVIFGDAGLIERENTSTTTTELDRIRTKSTSFGDADTIQGNGDADIVFGGAGEDDIDGGEGANILFGDFGEVDLEQGIVNEIFTTDPSVGASDIITSGLENDIILGGANSSADDIDAGEGDNIVFGDFGKISYGLNSDLSDIDRIASIDFSSGGTDLIDTGDGNDIIIGGLLDDTIDAGDGENIVLGDNGIVDYVTSDGDASDIDLIGSLDPTVGGADDITTTNGNDIIIGGAGGDTVTAGAGDNLILGDNGEIVAAASGAPQMTGQPITIGSVVTTDSTTGGGDTITTLNGRDIILGGAGGDTITASDLSSMAPSGDDNIVFGDHGTLQYDATGGSAALHSITSTDFTAGGDDILTATNGNDIVVGGVGLDTLTAGAGQNILFGDHGVVDYVVFDLDPAFVDEIATLSSLNGDADTITSLGGDDVVLGGASGDTLNTGDGVNLVIGDHGTIHYGTAGALHSVTSTDFAVGGDDTMTTGTGNDTAIGGTGADTLDAGEGENILLGDHGLIDYVSSDSDATDIDRIETLSPTVGDVDSITTTTGDDIVIGGAGADIVTAGDGRNLVIGDSGSVVSASSDLPRFGSQPVTLGTVTNAVPAADVNGNTGGSDNLTTGSDADIVLGGLAGDVINAGDGDNILIGDHGTIAYDLTGASADLHSVTSIDFTEGGDDTITVTNGNDIVIGGVGGDVLNGGDGENIVIGDHGVIDYVGSDSDPSDVDSIQTLSTPNGGADTITTLSGNDLILGGGAGDTVFAGVGNDLIFGDFGRISGDVDALALPLTTLPAQFAFTSINETDPNGGDDTIHAEAGDDIVLGQQGNDTVYAGADDDDVIGGHNVSGGHDGDDRLDGGAGFDVIAGDNATINRRNDQINPRMRTLSGSTIYGEVVGVNDGQSLHDSVHRVNPRIAGGSVERDIVLLDHSDSTSSLLHGDDTIAGGADDDEIFGQLGDDVIQGDGSIDESVSGQRDPATGALLDPSVEAGTDGDDYIEGNGGDDLIFGNLGQDDIVGGNSTLYGLTTPSQRPDGSDVIFGGAGTSITRLHDGSGLHSEDADTIAGDNANIYRLVSVTNSTVTGFLAFNYDSYGESRTLIPRAVQFFDYTPGGIDFDPLSAAGDIGAGDRIHGESGDDTAYGMVGNDVLFGDAQDDDLIGGWGSDWISGGNGIDGVLGDDGRIYTSRNSTTGEPLYGIAGFANNELDDEISTGGNIQQAIINVSGALKKTVNLTPFNVQDPSAGSQSPHYDPAQADDVIFGGLGTDFLHGGSGDDAISGAEALPVTAAMVGTTTFGNGFLAPANPGNLLGFAADPTRSEEFFLYDEFNPLTKITVNGVDFLLNFNSSESVTLANGTIVTVTDDGDDRIFGDLGNDWIVGGTGRDHAYGGYGNDLLNMDDDLSSNGRLNDVPDTDPGYADIAVGGAGRDVLIANTEPDRLIDWTGEFNSYLVPFNPFGIGTVSRSSQPQLTDYLYDLSASDGADPTRAADTGNSAARNGEPDGELGLVTKQDTDWQDQTGAPDDPQPGNVSGGKRESKAAADFNNGTPQGFFIDSGNWQTSGGRLEVSPATLGSDAVSVLHLEDDLQTYFEITATINGGKPTGGLKSNAYLIFDYQSATDFKYAGVNISNDKIEIGYRDASGWHELVQTSSQLKADQDYQVLLVVNGTAATLIVDGNDQLTYVFDPRVDSAGISYGLNAGLVGLGANNSVSRIDNVAVQVLPPELTLEIAEVFSDGDADLFSGSETGAWSNADGKYTGSGTNSSPALSLVDLGVLLDSHPTRLQSNSYLELTTQLQTSAMSGIAFDVSSADRFKFAAVVPDENKVVIGHYTTDSGWVIDAESERLLDSQSAIELKLIVKGTSATVEVNGQFELTHVFNAALADGGFGLLTDGDAEFEFLMITTDDDAFQEASQETSEQVTSVEAGQISSELYAAIFKEDQAENEQDRWIV